ncbi:hypothetical protein IAR55_002968 [Kwoniella newhampshirensis]|uniref:Transcription initiation factor TFIID subunit 12 domain-containing protein n=1 Tax=Kwoniella newhampshirensis TaxID=1651941 RepID=A0AAW0Z058_9TREE
MSTPSSSTGAAQANNAPATSVSVSLASLSPANLSQLQLKFPQLLTEAERQLPEDRRSELFRLKMMSFMRNSQKAQQQRNQQQQQQPQQGGQGQQMQGGPGPQAHNGGSALNGIQGGQGQVRQATASPMMGMPPQQQQQQQQQQGQVGMGQNGQQGQQQQQMNPQNQDQMRLQQQQQQQQHLASMLEKTQRLQQQAVQHQQQQQQQQGQTPLQQQQQQIQLQLQQQQQQQQPQSMIPPLQHPTPGSIAAASPQTHVLSSPQTVRQSPSNSNHRAPTMSTNGIKTLVDNFPKLWELKRLGKLGPDQEKLFDQFINSPEGRNQLQAFQAHQARTLVENGLSNPVALPHGAQQQQQAPNMNGMQLPLAAQQQLNALQQQQQQGFLQGQHSALQQQLQQQFPQVPIVANSPHLGIPQAQQMQNPQLNQQQLHQLQLQRLAAAQAQAQAQALQAAQAQAQAQGRLPQHAQVSNVPNVNLTQAQLLARAQSQSQMLQQAGSPMAGQHLQDLQQQVQVQAQAQAQQAQQQQQQQQQNFGSPRAPQAPQVTLQQMQMNLQNATSRMGPEKAANLRNVLLRLANMSEEQRETAFRSTPQYRPLWNQANGITHVAAQQMAAQAQAQAQAAQAQLQSQVQAQGRTNIGPGAPPGVSSPHLGMQQPGTPNMQQQGRAGSSTGVGTSSFPATNNVPNLHIPPNKQRNLSQSSQGAEASPQMRPPMPQQLQAQSQVPQLQGQNLQQAQAIQRMINSGIPVNQAVQNVAAARQQQLAAAAGAAVANAAGINGVPFPPQGGQPPPGQHPVVPNQIHAANITPSMLIAQFSQHDMARPPVRMDQVRQPSDVVVPQLDKSASLLARARWDPTPESDAALREKLNSFQPPSKHAGRGTMGIMNRVMGEVVLERMPEGLRVIMDEAEGDLLGDDKEEGSGMPGQKKRKVQELAEGIDKALVVDRDVETLMLQLADEHCDLVSQISCSLAAHRKSNTIDRKDVQLAYETIFGRTIPGFSSDLIRLDQARSSRVKPMNSQRAAKLRLVSEAKIAWRKEKEMKRKREEEGPEEVDVGVSGEGQVDGVVVVNGDIEEKNGANGEIMKTSPSATTTATLPLADGALSRMATNGLTPASSTAVLA